jgi:hypothetical protein
MKLSFRPILALAAAIVLFAFVGCGTWTDNSSSDTTEKPTDKAAPGKPAEEHGHKASAHGGIIVPIGRDSYHGEAVFEKEGVLRFYTLGQDEARLIEVEARPLNAYARAEGGMESVSLILKPEPQPGDRPGFTSQLVGKLPRELWGKSVEVTIPTIRIGEERFRVGFKNAPQQHAEDPMPDKVANEDEGKLYLTAGGKYTAEDIIANGSQTASQKFRGFQPAHDLKPKAGDRICPITMTKANPQCTWIVGGKEYQFCCPPCVEEFVQLAKTKPEEIKAPEEYRQK